MTQTDDKEAEDGAGERPPTRGKAIVVKLCLLAFFGGVTAGFYWYYFALETIETARLKLGITLSTFVLGPVASLIILVGLVQYVITGTNSLYMVKVPWRSSGLDRGAK